MKTFLGFVVRIVRSVPVIGAGILDVVLLLVNATGIDFTMPSWGYVAVLAAGFLIESYRIFAELEARKVDASIVCGIYSGNHESWADAISFTIPSNPDFRPSFGIAIATDRPGTTYKGVLVTLSFYWRGDVPSKGITIRPPSQDKRWQEISGHIVMDRPATFRFNAPEEAITNGAPLLLQPLTFHVVERLKGYILIKCVVTGLEPRASRAYELVINLAP